MTTRRQAEAEVIEASGEGAIHDLIERGREALEDPRESAEALLAETRRYVKKHPARSLLIAAGVGFVLGSLWGRRG